ncbi:MAG: response regulator [Verrucomicrobiota bacterium]
MFFARRWKMLDGAMADLETITTPAPGAVVPFGAGHVVINAMTTLAIVEDNATVRQTLVRWINEAPGYRCICECGTAEEAIAKLPRLVPDVVLMDIQLPNLSGIACTVRLRELLPKVQIIMVTVYRDYDRIFKALQAGACGYLLKRGTQQELLHAIEEVRSGGAPMSSEIARRLVESFQKPVAEVADSSEITRRGEEILNLLCDGYSNKEIAERLHLSVETIRTHLRRIYERLHVRSRTEAALKYRELRDQPPSNSSTSRS